MGLIQTAQEVTRVLDETEQATRRLGDTALKVKDRLIANSVHTISGGGGGGGGASFSLGQVRVRASGLI